MFIRIHYLLSCVKLPTLYKFPLCFPHELLTTFGSNSSKYDTEVFTGISKSECFLMHEGFIIPVKSNVEYLNWLLKPTSTLKYFKSTSTLKYFKGTSTLKSTFLLSWISPAFPWENFKSTTYFEDSSSTSFKRPIKH